MKLGILPIYLEKYSLSISLVRVISFILMKFSSYSFWAIIIIFRKLFPVAIASGHLFVTTELSRITALNKTWLIISSELTKIIAFDILKGSS